MPSPAEYDDKSKWMQVCIPRLIDEGKPKDQASAICFSMWERKEKPKQNSQAILFSNGFRSVTHDGREYLIVPGVPAREQVMNTYLVPGDEIAKTVLGWNGTPITIQHPKLNGGSAKVPAPDVAVIGRFYNAGWDQDRRRMTGEYWIDVNEASRYVEGQKIVEAIENGQVLETSTGYWADDEMTAGEFDGRPFQTVHRNLLPDHIAILTNVPGACSVRDGCGVNINVKHNCAEDHECDCPFKIKSNNPSLPGYENGNLPTAMLVKYCFDKGNRTPEQIEGLRDYIKKNGIDKPVIVVQMEDGNIKILDGNHRVSMAEELGIKQIPVKTYNADLQLVEPEIIYKLWEHREDQGYIKVNGGESHNAGHSRMNANLSALINSTKESPMNLQALQKFLEGKGIILNAEVVGDEVEFRLEEKPPAAGSPDVPSLSANEMKVLKALVANEQAVQVLDKLPSVLEFAQNAEAQIKAEREQVIAEIKQNGAVPFSDDELGKMDLPMLQKLNAMSNVNYSGIAGGSRTLFGDGEVLVVPTVLTNWKKKEE
jgi:hypothetical protein